MPLIAKNENNAENAQQKADGWPGRWNWFEPRFLGIGGETQSGGFWDLWSGGVSLSELSINTKKSNSNKI